MGRRWVIPATVAGLAVVAVGLFIRSTNSAKLIPATEPDIAEITGSDLAWQYRVKGPFVRPAEIGRIADDPRVAEALRLMATSPSTKTSATEIRSTWPLVERLTVAVRGRSLAAPGPVPRGYSLDSDGSGDFTDLSSRRNLAKLIASHIRVESDLRNRERCFAAASAAREYEQLRWRSGTTSLMDYLVTFSEESILNRAIEQAAVNDVFSFEQLKSLYDSTVTATTTDRDMASAIRYEWNYFTLPYLRMIQSDPDFRMALNDNEITFGSSSSSEHNGFTNGTLDVPDTLRLVARLNRERLSNLDRRWRDQDTRQARILIVLGKALPDEPKLSSTANALQNWWEATRYKVRMNSLPNSLGIKMLADQTEIGSAEVSFKRRTAIEADRLLLLIAMYRQQHSGRLPASLSELSPYLSGEPMPRDCFADAPFRYNATRKVVWSVGPDGVDNGGTAPAYALKAKDFVFPAGR